LVYLAAFSVPLQNITGCFADKKEASEFHVTALVPRTLVDQSLVQSDFQVKCHDAGDVVEWIETLQSVVTDRNIRAMNEQNRVCSPPFHSVIEGRPPELPRIWSLIF